VNGQCEGFRLSENRGAGEQGRNENEAKQTEVQRLAPKVCLEFHGELVGGVVGGGFGFGGEVEDKALEDEEFVGGGAAEF